MYSRGLLGHRFDYPMLIDIAKRCKEVLQKAKSTSLVYLVCSEGISSVW